MYRILLILCYYVGTTSTAPQDSDITYVRMLPAIAKNGTEQPSESRVVLGLQESKIENVPLIIGNGSRENTHSPEMQGDVRRDDSTTAPSTISKETTTGSAYTSAATQTENSKPAEGKFNKKSSNLKNNKYFKNLPSTTLVAKMTRKRKFRSKCRCERLFNCPKLQITIPRCPEEYFMCCF